MPPDVVSRCIASIVLLGISASLLPVRSARLFAYELRESECEAVASLPVLRQVWVHAVSRAEKRDDRRRLGELSLACSSLHTAITPTPPRIRRVRLTLPRLQIALSYLMTMTIASAANDRGRRGTMVMGTPLGILALSLSPHVLHDDRRAYETRPVRIDCAPHAPHLKQFVLTPLPTKTPARLAISMSTPARSMPSMPKSPAPAYTSFQASLRSHRRTSSTQLDSRAGFGRR